MSTSIESSHPGSTSQLEHTALELDTVAQTVTPLRKRSSAHAGFCMKSCNSAFLEDLFGDIAATSLENEELEPETTDDATVEPTTEELTVTVSVASDHNLSKRRRVSTNKSLGRSRKSLANLASFASIRRKQSSVLLSSEATITTAKPKKDLPATVSASYSFTLDVASREQALPEEGSDQKGEEADFGWFVDTDDHPVGDIATTTSACGTSQIPLAFTAPTAPVAHDQGHQAEVE